jgi:hypothetical protein
MTEPDPEVDEQRLDAIHAALTKDEPVLDLVRPWGPAEAQRLVDMVISEFIGELNDALGSHGKQPYGVDGSLFLRRYSLLWEAKQAL